MNEWLQYSSDFEKNQKIDENKPVPDESIEKPKLQPEPPKDDLSDDDINTKALSYAQNQFGGESEFVVVADDVGVKVKTEYSNEVVDISQYPDYIWSDNTSTTEINFEELDEIENDLKSGNKTLDDFGTLYTIDTDEDGKIIYTSIRNAEFKKDKEYLDNQTKEQRFVQLSKGFNIYIK